MNVSVEPGKYVLAVSGGVDSMVLLDVLQALPSVVLTVAHFDHGIRPDSGLDQQTVAEAAKHYNLPYAYEQGNLGAGASENQARYARYAFLRRVQQDAGAQAIITAHHQDDLLETAIINMVRGTGRKGLSSLSSSDGMLRPLLHVQKQAIVQYAHEHPDIVWRTDSTNASDDYLRNYLRHHVMGRIEGGGREQLLGYIQKANEINPQIDSLLQQQIDSHMQNGALNRQWFIMLPYDLSCEVMAAWLRSYNIRAFDRKTIERLVVAAKVAIPGKVADIIAGYLLNMSKTSLSITRGSLS